LGRLGDFTFWLLVLRYKYAYGACFFEKKNVFSLGARRPPYTGGSKKLYLALDLKRKKRKRKKEKEKKRARKRNLQERDARSRCYSSAR
jgi:hypothetical protein